MKARLEQRLAELRAEYEKGQQRLSKLEEERETVRMALLRISGAIQVLEEELGKGREGEEELESFEKDKRSGFS